MELKPGHFTININIGKVVIALITAVLLAAGAWFGIQYYRCYIKQDCSLEIVVDWEYTGLAYNFSIDKYGKMKVYWGEKINSRLTDIDIKETGEKQLTDKEINQVKKLFFH